MITESTQAHLVCYYIATSLSDQTMVLGSVHVLPRLRRAFGVTTQNGFSKLDIPYGKCPPCGSEVVLYLALDGVFEMDYGF